MLQNLFISFMALDVDPMNFVENLVYMGKGMLGIIFVMGILIAITTILNKVASKQKKDKEDK